MAGLAEMLRREYEVTQLQLQQIMNFPVREIPGESLVITKWQLPFMEAINSKASSACSSKVAPTFVEHTVQPFPIPRPQADNLAGSYSLMSSSFSLLQIICNQKVYPEGARRTSQLWSCK